MEHYLLVGAGGSIGALLSYAISRAVGQRYRGSWPLGTFVINLTGAFALGLMVSILSKSSSLGAFLGVGILGGYTTFSTYVYEAVFLMEEGYFKQCFSYLALSLVLGVFCYTLGFWPAKPFY